jgi:hypothetical protein
MGEYDVDEDTARNDVRRLAGELIAEGILRRA